MPGDCPALLHILLFVRSSVENIPLQAEPHSGSRQRLFGLPPESVFSFRPECCSASQRNGVRLQSGIAFTFDRIPQEARPSRSKPDRGVVRAHVEAINQTNNVVLSMIVVSLLGRRQQFSANAG